MTVFAEAGKFNGLAVAIFAGVLAVTLLITRWAAKRTHSTKSSAPPAAASPGRSTASPSPATTCRRRRSSATPGLMYLYGFDGWVFGLGALLSFLPVLYLLAERMRNAGKFTVADVLAFRLQRAARARRDRVQHAADLRHLPGRAADRRGRRDRGAGRASRSRSPC